MRNVVLGADRLISRLVETVAILLLLAAACLAFYQVLTRFLLEEPSTWTEVLTRTLIIWSVYLGALILFRRGTLISVDVAYRLAGPRARKVLNLAQLLASLAVLLTAFVFGLQLAWRVRFQVLAGLDVSIAYAYLAVPVGAFLSAVGAVAAYLERR
jgi:TRAP-type C4-dicarboxylate transport system permease small subunit